MAPPTHDYDQLEREYLSSKLTIRALCRKHDIKSYSSVAQYAREHNWYGRRDEIQSRAQGRTIEKVAERLAEAEADEIEQFRTEALTVIRAAVYKFADNLKDPEFRMRADDLTKMIQLGLLITGQPTSRVEERRLDVVATFDGLPADVLRGLAEATRPRPALGRTAGDDPRARAPHSRQN